MNARGELGHFLRECVAAMRGLLLVSIAAVGFGLAACGGGSDAPADPPAAPPPGNVTATCGLPNFEDDLMLAINAARSQARMCGGANQNAVAAVGWHDRLYAAAAAHSSDMATNNYFSHTSPNGGTLATRLVAAGYSYRVAGENIAFNYRSVADVTAGWLASPGHCANIMDARFRDVGVACVRNGRDEPYWTMDLGSQ